MRTCTIHRYAATQAVMANPLFADIWVSAFIFYNLGIFTDAAANAKLPKMASSVLIYIKNQTVRTLIQGLKQT